MQNSIAEAKQYLNRSLAIFEAKNMQKMVREVKAKLKLAQTGNRAQMMIEAQREFKDNKSDEEEEGDPKRAGVRKGSKGPQRKIKTNNYVD